MAIAAISNDEIVGAWLFKQVDAILLFLLALVSLYINTKVLEALYIKTCKQVAYTL